MIIGSPGRLSVYGHPAIANPNYETNEPFASLVCDWLKAETLKRRSSGVLHTMASTLGWFRNHMAPGKKDLPPENTGEAVESTPLDFVSDGAGL